MQRSLPSRRFDSEYAPRARSPPMERPPPSRRFEPVYVPIPRPRAPPSRPLAGKGKKCSKCGLPKA